MPSLTKAAGHDASANKQTLLLQLIYLQVRKTFKLMVVFAVYVHSWAHLRRLFCLQRERQWNENHMKHIKTLLTENRCMRTRTEECTGLEKGQAYLVSRYTLFVNISLNGIPNSSVFSLTKKRNDNVCYHINPKYSYRAWLFLSHLKAFNF